MTREQCDAHWRKALRVPPDQRGPESFRLLQDDFGRSASIWLTKNKLGPGLTREDIEDVVSDACVALWSKFDPAKGERPTAFFNSVVANGAKERLRRFISKKARAMRRMVSLVEDIDLAAESTALSGEGLDALERDELLVAISEASQLLTPREKLAFDERFSGRQDSCWTASLIATHGKDAQYWRKASDDALARIRADLRRRGLQQEDEKGGNREAL